MAKITKVGDQYRLTIPSDIMDATGWSENTQLLFVPFVQAAKDDINKDTPILLKVFKPENKPAKKKGD